ncbi:hypothetical protein CBR_g6682 [Chara braunii]|uniref:Myb/SANT-like DNA-binding domain-containing protein n=1 Tax=Chara braunii TaxID=69332 RepID=A0A388KKJ9_CHABU|nr:hypothetical protein CBR_g6682 [Chara braunii]|eukprot:GBG70556.1 hypothetical protein CBR_g6682 [Chara braunii]
MGGRGGKTRACARNGRRGKIAVGKGSDAEADADTEGGRQFWSVDDMIALIRAKRDQDAHLQGMGTAFARMKLREWKWLDVEQRLKKVGVNREAERCGKKWDNLMQQFKKVHHFQGLSGKQDFFQFSRKERLSKGFNFNMDRAVYDEILGSTAKSHTINPKNVVNTGAPGGVRLPSASFVDHESVGDGDAAAGHDDDDGSTRGSSQTTGSPTSFGKRKITRKQTFKALTECMEKHGAQVASTMESNMGLSRVMSSRGSGRGKSAGKLAVEAAIREKKRCHVANKLRKVVEGSSSLAINVEDEDWVAERVASQVETDFEEEEEVPLKRKSSRRGSGALWIEDIGERRGGGGRAVMEDVIDVNAAVASRQGVGTAVTHQHRAPVPRVNEGPIAQEVVVRARTPGTLWVTTGTDIGVNAQVVGQGKNNRSPAQELRGAASGGAAHAGEGARAGGAAAGGASHAGEGARAGGAATARASHAAEGTRAGGVKPRGGHRWWKGRGQGMSQERGRTTKR